MPAPTHMARINAYQASLRQGATDAERAGRPAEARLLRALISAQHVLIRHRIDLEEDDAIPEALRDAAEEIAREVEVVLEGVPA